MNWTLPALRALKIREYGVLVQWLTEQQREQQIELDYHDPQ
jgi:cell division inhibitor SulA